MSPPKAILRAHALFVFALLLIGVTTAAGQKGGKAEPKRIKFAPLSSTASVTGTLSDGQQYEFVFTARMGQTVTIVNSKTDLFDFRVFNDEFDLETKFETSRSLTFTIPGDGDYLLFVRKKMVGKPRTARFSLKLTIKSPDQ
jgi:hypothetical protein